MPTPLILHVAETLKGGIASYFDEILPEQAKEFGAHRVLLLFPKSHLSELPRRPPSRLMIFNPHARRWLNVFKLAYLTRRIVIQKRPSVVHAHSTIAGIASRLGLLFVPSRPKIVYCAHGWAFDRPISGMQSKVVALVERVLASCTDVIVCISEHDRASAITHGLPPGTLITLLNGIRDEPASDAVRRTAEWIEWPAGVTRVLYAGRFDHQKGTDLLAAAMGRLKGVAHAHAIGSAVLGDSDSLAWPANVTVHGWMAREDLRPYIESCDVLVMPSRWEGFGLIALEAMRAGKPVLAARVGGLAEIVVDGVTGLLFEPNDTDALTAALASLTPTDIRRMGHAARARYLTHYTAAKLSSALIALYCGIAPRVSTARRRAASAKPETVAAELPDLAASKAGDLV